MGAMLSGTLRTYGSRGFGIVEVHHKSGSQKGKIEFFFMLMKRVEFCEPDQGPYVGCRVQFEPSTEPVAEGKYPLCTHVRVFAPAAVPAGVVAALSGKPEDKQSGGVQ